MERLKNRKKKNNMKVMVSKVMERELNKFFKDKPPFNKYSFEYGECSLEEYKFHIGSPMDNEVDWLYEKSFVGCLKGQSKSGTGDSHGNSPHS